MTDKEIIELIAYLEKQLNKSEEHWNNQNDRTYIVGFLQGSIQVVIDNLKNKI